MSEEEDTLKAGHPAEVYLERLSREMTTMRKLMSELLKFYRNAESEIPEYMRRFANYMHDLHDIAYMYEERGLPIPRWIASEMERCDDRCRHLLEREHAEGTFGKVRAEMAEKSGNRWDHTRALTFHREDIP